MTAIESLERTVLIVGRTSLETTQLAGMASRQGWKTVSCFSLLEAKTMLETTSQWQVAAVILGERTDPRQARHAIPELKRLGGPDLAIIVLTKTPSAEFEEQALRAGADQCIAASAIPDLLPEVLLAAANQQEREYGKRYRLEDLSSRLDGVSILETDPVFCEAWRRTVEAARGQGSLLIEGELGTGKHLLARAFHAASPRSNMPLQVMNVGVHSGSALAAALFGYERGAFVGAFERSSGLLEHLCGATLVLDQIDALPAPVQERLAKALSSGVAQRLGSQRSIPLNVRIVALSDRPLDELVNEQRFSRTLRSQLGDTYVNLASLRCRPNDIAGMVVQSLARLDDPSHPRGLSIDEEALSLLSRFPWPGNSRQLSSVILRAVALAQDAVLGREDFTHFDCFQSGWGGEAPAAASDLRVVEDSGHIRPLAEIEAEVIRMAIKRYDGRIAEIARRLGIGRSTLYRKLAQFGLDSTPG